MYPHFNQTCSSCLFCFGEPVIPTVVPKNTNKLFDICCKYLHSAIISETDKHTVENSLSEENPNVTFCVKCLQSAIELAGLVEQLEYCQRNITELIFMFSLRILHRRKTLSPNFNNENFINRKIEEFDISGLPDLDNDNNYESPSFESKDSEENPLCPEVEYNNIEIEAPPQLFVTDAEFFNSDEITVSAVKIESQLSEDANIATADFHENSIECEDDGITVSVSPATACLTIKNENPKRPIKPNATSTSKKELLKFPLPFVKLERMDVTTGSDRHLKNLKIEAVTSLHNQYPPEELDDRSESKVKVFNDPELLINSLLSSIGPFTENLDREILKDKTEYVKRYRGDDPDEPYDPKFGDIYNKFKCRICKKRFKFKSVFDNHKRTHNTDKPFSCDVCGKGFKNKQILVNHGRIHTGEKPYECNVCNKRFTFQSGLFIHKAVHSAEKRYQCSVCEKGFKYKNALLVHMKVHSDERRRKHTFGNRIVTPSTSSETKEFKCDVCHKTYSTKQTLMIHQNLHTGERPYSCSECSKSFRQASSLYVHRNVHMKPHKCTMCNKRFSQKSLLDTHLLSKHEAGKVLVKVPEKAFEAPENCECPVCHKVYANRNSLMLHQSIHTGEKPYSCSECSKSFRLAQTLQIHMNVHNKPYQCDICNKRFALKSALDTHIAKHEAGKVLSLPSINGQDPEDLQCSVCHKVCATKQTLMNHQLLHTGERPYSCSVCLKSFTQPSGLYTHRKVHVKPHKCPVCLKRFALKGALNIHIARKHSEIKCKCRDCGKIFSTVEQLKGHYKRIHFAIDYTDDCAVTIS